VDKCPPTICRAKLYQDYFSKFGKVYFISSIRNPYATQKPINLWVKYAKMQKYNIENLDNLISTSYEELVLKPEIVLNRIKDNIPFLDDISLNFSNNQTKVQGKTVNTDSLNRVTKKEKKNKLLETELEILNYFNYNFIE